MKFITIGTNSFKLEEIQGFSSTEHYSGEYKNRMDNIYFQLIVIISGKEFIAVRENQERTGSQEETDNNLQSFHNRWLKEINKESIEIQRKTI